MQPHRFSYESMGTHWSITIWDIVEAALLQELQSSIINQSTAFDHTYSRFIHSSLIWRLTKQRGLAEVPTDLVAMLRLYEKLYDLSDGKCNPLVGFALSDMGYDADYSLTPKATIRPVPGLHDALRIVDDTYIELRESVLIDLGALGKGFFVDKIAAYLRSKGMKRFLVDGSGDVFYSGNGESIRVGLEHPGDPAKVIGVVDMQGGAMCSSARNRRAWAQYHHTIDPHSLTSPHDILATWVMAESAAVADGLATCLFLTEPEKFAQEWQFSYCLLNPAYAVQRSANFGAELF